MPPIGIPRRTLLTGAAAASAALAAGALAPTSLWAVSAADCVDRYDSPDLSTRAVKPITFPIQGTGINRLRNYGDNRGSHIHAGEDIGAPKMNKLVACASGTIVRLKHDGGGNYLYLQADDGWIYGYLHINNDRPGTDDGSNIFGNAFAPGMAVGRRVTRGEFIAYVGDSGNAEGTIAHVHFEIRKPNCKWYWAQAIDPGPSLDAATSPNGPAVPPSTFKPWTTAEDLIARQYGDFGVAGSGAATWEARLNSGSHRPHEFIAALATSAASDVCNQSIARLYQAFFLRLPDAAGFRHWTNQVRFGVPLRTVANSFAGSAEFKGRYGSLDDGQYVDRIYRNVLGRDADANGRRHWVGQLSGGMTRGAVMLEFSQSAEFRGGQKLRADVLTVWLCMLRRSPGTASVDGWADRLAAGSATLNTLVNTILPSSEYATVVRST